MTAACLAVTRLYNQFRLQNVRARLLLVAIIILLAPAQSEAVQYREVEWTELMPKEDLAALLDPPDFLNGIEDGSQQVKRVSRPNSPKYFKTKLQGVIFRATLLYMLSAI